MTGAQAQILDGRTAAQDLRDRLKLQVARLRADHGVTPGLAVVILGEDAASQIYVRNKTERAEEVGLRSWLYRLPAETPQDTLLQLIGALNRDPGVHGILVQLPLPEGIDEAAVTNAIDPQKDVDGFHVHSAGRLLTGQASLVPCTPLGSLILIRRRHEKLDGLDAVVLGRSNIVGKPMALLLLRENCTVTVAHSKSRNLAEICRRADLLVAAVGRPQMVRGDWIKPGATVIDVGINRIPADGGKTRVVGDVAFDEAVTVAGAVTPVPGGVGLMTVACLLANTLQAACAIHGVAIPPA